MSLAAPQWEESRGAWLVYLVPLLAFTIAFPHLLSRIWKTSTLPTSPLRDRLTELTRRMGVRCRDFRIWQTDRQVLNAAVAGLLPSVRTIFMTDALLLYLRDDEMEAVIAHELGHVRAATCCCVCCCWDCRCGFSANLQAFSPQVSELATAWQSGLASELSAGQIPDRGRYHAGLRRPRPGTLFAAAGTRRGPVRVRRGTGRDVHRDDRSAVLSLQRSTPTGHVAASQHRGSRPPPAASAARSAASPTCFAGAWHGSTARSCVLWILTPLVATIV